MIELRGVSKTVSSGGRPLTILHPLDLTVRAGERLAIVGPSGSGKSTLLGLMAGLDPPSTGADPHRRHRHHRASARTRWRACAAAKIGFVFQFFHLVPSLTAFENVLVPMEIAGRRGRRRRGRAALLDEVGLADRGHHYPSQLSGGEQQRVARGPRARQRAAVVMADEPTGNLDSANGQHVIDLLFDVHARRGTTLVLVTHDAALAARADVQLVAARRPRRRAQRRRPAPGARAGAGRRLTGIRHGLRPAHGRTGDARRLARLVFFFVCIAIGVGAIAAIRSIIDQVTRRASRARRGR